MGVDAEMLVRTRKAFTPLEVTHLAADLAEAFGSNWFWIFKGKDGHHALSLIDVYEQDGDDIVPKPGEYFIRAHLRTRYYGEDYERGNWPFISNVARWLRTRIPDASIWYGGDSSGICAEELTPEKEQSLWNLFCGVGHKPYHAHFTPIFGGKGNIVTCAFCGNRPLISIGGGGGDSFWRCSGCGDRVITCVDGTSHLIKDNEDFFKAHERIKKGEK